VRSRAVLGIIVGAQFCGTSLWFASNGVMTDIVNAYSLESTALGHLTSAVQLGFITGTLLFAFFNIADRFSPSKVFFVCALLGSVLNMLVIWQYNSLISLILFRFGTGFFLAGIYPVGMKIAADYFDKSLGKSLGYLVGALVLGTGFPHLLNALASHVPWRGIIWATSVLAFTGGLVLFLFVKDGPYRKAGAGLRFSAFLQVFKNKHFSAAAFGYFGHMWELYAFWAFVPVMLRTYAAFHSADLNVPLLSFFIIGIGGPACVVGGYGSLRLGTRKTAFMFLSASLICCLVSPLLFNMPVEVFLAFLLLWGVAVIPDSPLFSTLVAQNAAAEVRGSALTLVNSLGFAITIVSIQLLNFMQTTIASEYLYLFLAIGPVTGLWALAGRRNTPDQED